MPFVSKDMKEDVENVLSAKTFRPRKRFVRSQRTRPDAGRT